MEAMETEAASGYFSFSVEDWPIAYFSLTGTLSDSHYHQYLEKLLDLPNRRQKFGLILDGSSLDPLSAKQRQMSAAALESGASSLREYCVGMSFIVQNKLLQGALTAIFWVRSPPVEFIVRTKVLDAVGWLAPRLRNAGAPAPTERDVTTIAARMQLRRGSRSSIE